MRHKLEEGSGGHVQRRVGLALFVAVLSLAHFTPAGYIHLR